MSIKDDIAMAIASVRDDNDDDDHKFKVERSNDMSKERKRRSIGNEIHREKVISTWGAR